MTAYPWHELAAFWNAHDFGHAHDWLGERWNALIQTRPGGHDDPDARFLQGLAFAALAFHFTLNRNQEGAQLLAGDALKVLPEYRPAHLGVEVAPFLQDLRQLLPLLDGLETEADCPLAPFTCHPFPLPS